MSLANWFRIRTGSRPKLPAGTTYVVDCRTGNDTMHAAGVPYFLVLTVPPGRESDDTCEQVGPNFTDSGEAAKYAAWLSGKPAYQWPEGAA